MTQPTTPWQDRFTTPSADALLAAIDETRRPPIDALRAALLQIPDIREEVLHMGTPWRWAFCYTSPSDDRFAFLIPNPERPLICLPVPESFLEGMSLRKLSRPVRDGLTHARLVGGIIWAEWELNAKSLADELAEIAAQKRAAGAASES